MSKNVTNQEHFRHRAASYSTRGARTGVNLLGWDTVTDESMTYEQKREAIIAAIKHCEEIRHAIRDPQERRENGKRILELGQMLSALREQKPKGPSDAPPDFRKFLIHRLRDHVSFETWCKCVDQAQGDFDSLQKSRGLFPEKIRPLHVVSERREPTIKTKGRRA